MTAQELIEELKLYPGDAKITVTVGGEVCDDPMLVLNDKCNILDIGTT